MFSRAALFGKVWCFALFLLSSLKGLHGFFGGFLWFDFVSSMILLYWSSDQHRHVLVTFINSNSCFWMGWFTTAANIKKSRTIVPLHCTNNSGVYHFAGNAALSGSFRRGCCKGSRVSEDLCFFPFTLVSFLMQLCFSPRETEPILFIEITVYFHCGVNHFWSWTVEGQRWCYFWRGKKTTKSPAKQNRFCAVLDKMLLKL